MCMCIVGSSFVPRPAPPRRGWEGGRESERQIEREGESERQIDRERSSLTSEKADEYTTCKLPVQELDTSMTELEQKQC